MKRALITGITGQDGAYLAELLLDKNYEVHGIKRRASLINTARIDHIYQDPHIENARFVLHYGDMTDSSSLQRTIQRVQPDEIYNLAAQSHVAVSFEEPEYTANSDALGTLRMLEAIQNLGLEKTCRFYQASTSELYGKVAETPQNEQTPFYPRSPYGVAKLYGYWITVNYREAYGLYACNGILFNHESPRRGETFVTRKITRALARIAYGMEDCLYLGNLNARRDWGHARDFVEAMWLMLQQEKAEDFVIATGVQHSVRDFVTAAARCIGVEMEWRGEGEEEVGVVARVARGSKGSTFKIQKEEGEENAEGGSSAGFQAVMTGKMPAPREGKIVVRVDPRYYRPTEVETLLGDPSKAKAKLGWEPKVSFEELVREMMESDLGSVSQLAC